MEKTGRRYQVEMQTLGCDWVNTWTEEDEHGKARPQTFDSRAEAAAALDEFLAEVRIEVEIGNMDVAYRRSDFRVSRAKTVG